MDRNINFAANHIQPLLVALRKESVDRNNKILVSIFSNAEVALRKESVDRNRPSSNWLSES